MSETSKDTKASLRRRANRFLTTNLYGRREVGLFCDRVGSVGDVAIFGGMLRDLLLEGNARFSSDIDLVIDTDDFARLHRVLQEYEPVRTTFGGYRIQLQKWVIDLWPLKATWAIREGHVSGETLADLTRTTFFNWDAVVYELRSGVVHCAPGYPDELRDRVLAINLEPNPNPEGAAIRALRMAVTKQARLSVSLAQYAADVLETVGVEKLAEMERSKHRPARVSTSQMFEFLQEFKRFKAESQQGPVAIWDRQMKFAFYKQQTSRDH